MIARVWMCGFPADSHCMLNSSESGNFRCGLIIIVRYRQGWVAGPAFGGAMIARCPLHITNHQTGCP